jgi:hypothetical protein
VKDIHRQTGVLETGIIPDVFGKGTVIVEEDMIGHLPMDSKGALDKFLQGIWSKFRKKKGLQDLLHK